MIVFDLDPDPEIPHPKLADAAHLVKDYLEDLGLQSFVKTTGGKGFHLVIPLKRKNEWDVVNGFAKAVATRIAHENPIFTANMSKAKRTGKIYLDYVRNSRGATYVAPFSTRARPYAPVSTLLRWDEVKGEIDPAGWTIANIEKRLAKVRDPWKGFDSIRQSLTGAILKKVGA